MLYIFFLDGPEKRECVYKHRNPFLLPISRNENMNEAGKRLAGLSRKRLFTILTVIIRKKSKYV